MLEGYPLTTCQPVSRLQTPPIGGDSRGAMREGSGQGAAPAPVKGLRKALRLEVPKAKPEGL